MTKPKRVNVHIREAFEAQLPIVAAILASAEEDPDPAEIAQDAIALVSALEEELEDE